VGVVNKVLVFEGEVFGLEGMGYYLFEWSTFVNGMYVVVVEIDFEIVEIWILCYCVVYDCGNLINPMIVEG